MARYNEKYNDNVQFEDITDYQIHKFLKPECKNVFKEVVDDEFILNLELLEGAKEALNYLSQHYYVYFVTAAYPYTLEARNQLLSNTFDWYRSNQLVRFEDKWFLRFDYLGDDCLDNLRYFKSGRILMTKPWNEKLYGRGKKIKRVNNWTEIMTLLIQGI